MVDTIFGVNTFSVKTSQLEIGYEAFGRVEGWPCILNHGFPYDIHCYTECVEPLVEAGAYVVIPYLRGFGPTRFLSKQTIRSGEQAALANDLMEFMDALSMKQAVLAGYDWGGRAACIVAALWPSRVLGLVTGNSYNIQNIPRAMEPATPEEEARLWYQYYFHSERGRRGLEVNRTEIARLLWRLWSPTWQFTEMEFSKSSASLMNADFVDVVVHSYRHRFGLVEGDPMVAHIETKLESQPDIIVPAICIDGDVNGVASNTSHHSAKFTGPYEYRLFQNTGHNLPQEKPHEWVQAILDVCQFNRD